MIARIVSTALLVLLAGGCAGNGLPLHVSGCTAVPSTGGVMLLARVRSEASKPIARARVLAEFYSDFRSSHLIAQATFAPELDPKQSREVRFSALDAGRESITGDAMRCTVTHLDYLDGTNADLPGSLSGKQ
ncbi:MAG: hypothetical protein M3R35_05290 [Candidatus Eremiobacteraeota bacterium]|nr:hypothetical protein [Candidatus Eremiobacteraeota bacterium]